MPIYTKKGDTGTTSLFDGTRVSKNNIRLETYGTFDELSCILGIANSFLHKDKKTQKMLVAMQRDFLDIGSYLANPQEKVSPQFTTYLDSRILFFEKTIDAMTEKLPPLKNFLIFKGNTSSSYMQLARSIARRCERRLVALSQQEEVELVFIRYFNRLSDFLYTISRFLNRKNKEKEIIWKRFIK